MMDGIATAVAVVVMVTAVQVLQQLRHSPSRAQSSPFVFVYVLSFRLWGKESRFIFISLVVVLVCRMEWNGGRKFLLFLYFYLQHEINAACRLAPTAPPVSYSVFQTVFCIFFFSFSARYFRSSFPFPTKGNAFRSFSWRRWRLEEGIIASCRRRCRLMFISRFYYASSSSSTSLPHRDASHRRRKTKDCAICFPSRMEKRRKRM